MASIIRRFTEQELQWIMRGWDLCSAQDVNEPRYSDAYAVQYNRSWDDRSCGIWMKATSEEEAHPLAEFVISKAMEYLAVGLMAEFAENLDDSNRELYWAQLGMIDAYRLMVGGHDNIAIPTVQMKKPSLSPRKYLGSFD